MITRGYNGSIMEAVHETACDLHEIGPAGDSQMQVYQALCHESVPNDSAEQVLRPRQRYQLSQAAFASRRIAQVCMQDFGGAGIAALRLHDGLRSIGMGSIFYAHNMQRWKPGATLLNAAARNTPIPPDAPFIAPEWRAFGHHNHRQLSSYTRRPSGLEMFSDTWSAIRLADIPELDQADILHFHWIAGTVDIPAEVAFLKNRTIVWTLHDMNAFTGGCHYTAGCTRYVKECGQCPQLGSVQDADLAHQNWKRKQAAYAQLNMTIVTPSRWLADCARQSRLLSAFPVHVIPYGLPLDTFRLYSQPPLREALNIPPSRFVVLFGADSVTNVRKGLGYLLEAMEVLKEQPWHSDILVALFGHHAKAVVQQLGFETLSLGHIQQESEMAKVYNMADVAVIPSLEDNLPNIVLESLACGTPVVGFEVGGIPDMVTHEVNGYLACLGNVDGLAKGICWAQAQKQAGRAIQMQCRHSALARYSLALQARRYAQLYARLKAAPRSSTLTILGKTLKHSDCFFPNMPPER